MAKDTTFVSRYFMKCKYSAEGGAELFKEVSENINRLAVYLLLHDPHYMTLYGEIRFSFHDMCDYLHIYNRRKNSPLIQKVFNIFEEFKDAGIVTYDGDSLESHSKLNDFTIGRGNNYDFNDGNGYTIVSADRIRQITEYSTGADDNNTYLWYVFRRVLIWICVQDNMYRSYEGQYYAIINADEIADTLSMNSGDVQKVLDTLSDDMSLYTRRAINYFDEAGDYKCRGILYAPNGVYSNTAINEILQYEKDKCYE